LALIYNLFYLARVFVRLGWNSLFQILDNYGCKKFLIIGPILPKQKIQFYPGLIFTIVA
jgi:hypothetical protein